MAIVDLARIPLDPFAQVDDPTLAKLRVELACSRIQRDQPRIARPKHYPALPAIRPVGNPSVYPTGRPNLVVFESLGIGIKLPDFTPTCGIQTDDLRPACRHIHPPV